MNRWLALDFLLKSQKEETSGGIFYLQESPSSLRVSSLIPHVGEVVETEELVHMMPIFSRISTVNQPLSIWR